jgi:hypothetical protein
MRREQSNLLRTVHLEQIVVPYVGWKRRDDSSREIMREGCTLLSVIVKFVSLVLAVFFLSVSQLRLSESSS